MADLRENALENLKSVLENKNDVFQANERSLDDDNAFVMMLTMTALRKMVYVKSILKTLITKKLSKQNIIGQCALILGAVELMYMNTPDYAVINSYVNIVKAKTDKYVAGFVNAVLRKIAKQKEIFVNADKGDFFPQEFKALLRKSYSSKEIEKIEKSSQNMPFLDISCVSAESAKKLGGKELPLGGLRLEVKGKISELPDYDKGTWWVQDFSSALAIKMLGDIKDKKVLELCSAPGGKTAQLLTRGAKVTCLDVNENRLKTLRENLQRLRLLPEKIICEDGIKYLEKTDEKYEIIVLDAPCSATGILRRHPEIVHTKKHTDVLSQAKIQKEFLDRIDNVLLPNGVLLYCTCSLCKEEGENQINDFVKNNTAYKVVYLEKMLPDSLKKMVTKEGYIRILPHYADSFGSADGFFIACLKKEG